MAKSKIRIFRDKSLYTNEKFDTRIYFKYYEQNSEGFYGIDVNGKIVNVKNTQYADLVTTDNDGNWIIPLHSKRIVALEYYEGEPEKQAYYIKNGTKVNYDGPLVKRNNKYYADIPLTYQVKRTFIADDGTMYTLSQMKNNYDIKGGKLYYSSAYVNEYPVIADFNQDDPDAIKYYYYEDSLGNRHYIDPEIEATKVYKVSETVDDTDIEINKPVYSDNNKWYYLSGERIYLTPEQSTNIEYIKTNDLLIYKEIVNIKYEIEVNVNGYPEYITDSILTTYMNKTYTYLQLVSLYYISYTTSSYGINSYEATPKVEAIAPYWYYNDYKNDLVKIYENPDNVTSIEVDYVTSISVIRYPAITSRYVYTDDDGTEYIYLGDTSLLTIDNDVIYADVYYDNINDPSTYYIERVYNGVTKRYYIFLTE